MGRNGDTGQWVFFLKQLIMETLVNFPFTLHYSRRNGLGYFDIKKLQMGKKMDAMPSPLRSVPLGFSVQNKCGVSNIDINVLGSS